MKFITKENTLFNHQYGFQKNKTTSLAILDIYTKIVSALENSGIACRVFLDFSKAFDTVNHSILLKKLENYGISGIPLVLYTSYLSKCYQAVKINNTISKPLKVTCGVSQGSVLGPLLFLLYINDIYKSSKQLSFHLFADDTAIYYSHDNIHSLQKNINIELRKVALWLNANKLSLNMAKSCFILFHPSQKKLPKIPLAINDLPIPEKPNVKYLGVILDKHLTWKEHVQHANMKIHKGMGILYGVRYFATSQILRSLYFAFIQSHIENCYNIWTCTAPTILEPIVLSMKKVIRILSYAKQDAHSDPLFRHCQLLNFDKLQTRLCKFEWDLHHNNVPLTIQNVLKRTVESTSRTKFSSTKYTPLYRTKIKKYFITTRSVPIWRDLPTKIKNIQNKKYFMKKLLIRLFITDLTNLILTRN